VDKLVEAINYAMSSGAIDSARILAQKMQRESGVDTAVESFYRWLPTEQLQCHIIPNQPARWSLERHKKQIKLSDAAVAALIAESKIKLNELSP
jgi:hypothetical protein